MTHSPLPFEQRLAESWPPESWRDVSVLVAVSGGPDSVALLRGLYRLHESAGDNMIVGHLNHRVRLEADEDEAFVRELAEGLGLDLEVKRLAPDSLDTRDGVEAAMREARYAFLQETAERLGTRHVVTAHTADDQAETVLHRIVRGTGLAGLAGIPRARTLSPAVSLLRPMLGITRAEVEEYLSEIGQAYRVDATNRDTSFTRNRVRHELLPLLADEYNAQVKEALLRLGSLAGEAQRLIDQRVAELTSRGVADHGEQVEIDCTALHDEPRYLVRELFAQLWQQRRWPLQDMSYGHWERLAMMTTALGEDVSSTQTFPGEVRAQREGQKLRLYHKPHP